MTVLLTLAEGNWMVHHLLEVDPLAYGGAWGVSKHVLVMALAGLALCATFIPFGMKIKADPVPRGRMVNFFESILLFLRDDIVRPALGKEGDRYLPVVWSFFFFILYCNLFGLIPIPVQVPVLTAGGGTEWQWLGGVTATGQIAVTGTLALIATTWYLGLGIKNQGLIPFIRHLVPGGVPLLLVPLIFLLEVIGHLVKPAALMIRLWANMTGGHAVLYSFIGFIFTFGAALAVVSVPAGIAIYFLEIFVAFLQAYVFTFLMVVFLQGSLHPH